MTIRLHHGDLPDGVDFGPVVAIDTETLGLNPLRDRLCLVQLSRGDGTADLVQIPQGPVRAPNLAIGNLIMGLLGAAWIPMWFFLNLYLQQVLGYGADRIEFLRREGALG